VHTQALLMPSIQVNMRAGQLPPRDVNGIHESEDPGQARELESLSPLGPTPSELCATPQ
jgi:hypothetical protein